MSNNGHYKCTTSFRSVFINSIDVLFGSYKPPFVTSQRPPVSLWSRSIIVRIATIWSGRSGVRISVEKRDTSLLRNVQTGSKTRPASYSIFTGGSFRVKCLGREVNHWPPSTAEIKNEWSHSSTTDMCVHSVDRKNFAFHPCHWYTTHQVKAVGKETSHNEWSTAAN